MQQNDNLRFSDITKEQMISHCVHELKTPLQTILGTIDLLKETDLTSEQAEYISHLEYGADILRLLTNDVLDFSKIQMNKLTLSEVPFNVKQTVENIVTLISVEVFRKNLEIVCDIDYSIPDLIMGDQLRFKQLLLNLLGNAMKFTKEGYIHTELLKAGENQLEFRITDSGIGVKDENQTHVFETYFQEENASQEQNITKYSGTGLGLPICKGLVNLMGGTIKYEKNPFGGSIFSFTIPYKTAKEADLKLYETNLPSDTKVLIVDGTKLCAQSLEKKLKTLGLQNVQFSTNAKEALLMMEYAENMGYPFNMVFIDMHIPIFDGWELSHRIRNKENLKTTRLFLTVKEGYLSQRARSHVKICFEDFIYKPLQIGLLKELITEKKDKDDAFLINEKAEFKENGKNASVNQAFSSKNNEQEERTPKFLNGKKVLVAEDDNVNRSIITELLKKTGANVLETKDGANVLKLFSENKDIEVFFLDLNMPSLNGKETAKELRKSESKAVLVACTAQNAVEIKDELKADGFNYALQKPFKKENLTSLLLRIEDEKNAAKRRKIWDYLDFENTIGRDEALGKKLLSEFLSQTQNILMNAQEASERNDLPQMKELFHKLKGSSLTISQKQIASLSEKLELACQRGDTPLIYDTLGELKDAFWAFRLEAENWKL